MEFNGIQRALEHGRIKQGVGHPQIDFLAGYNKAIEDTKAPEMLSMLNRIYSQKTVTFDDLLKIKELINKATEL